ncbi:hypothetical protein LGAA44_120051 [Leuconostoc gasicomitatum]|nr:hypothetical protein LGAA44_120051 [Leuconostoc gasicomitatum]
MLLSHLVIISVFKINIDNNNKKAIIRIILKNVEQKSSLTFSSESLRVM